MEGQGDACPHCDEGQLTQRRGRFGPFLGCSRYPDCDYIKKEGPPPPAPLAFEGGCPQNPAGRRGKGPRGGGRRAPPPPRRQARVTGAAALDGFLRALEARDASAHTRRAYATGIRQYLEWLSARPGGGRARPGRAPPRGYPAQPGGAGGSRT